MQSELLAHATTFGALPHGALYRYSASDREYLAIKASLPAIGDAMVTLNPINPTWSRRPVLYSAVAVDPNKEVLELEGAIIRASPVIGGIQLAGAFGPGDLVLTVAGLSLGVFLSQDHGTAHINLATGAYEQISRVVAVIREWTIIQLVDGEPMTVFSFPPSGP